MNRQRNLHTLFKSAPDISFNPLGVRMYEQSDIVVIWKTHHYEETAVKFADGWTYYSTEKW